MEKLRTGLNTDSPGLGGSGHIAFRILFGAACEVLNQRVSFHAAAVTKV